MNITKEEALVILLVYRYLSESEDMLDATTTLSKQKVAAEIISKTLGAMFAAAQSSELADGKELETLVTCTLLVLRNSEEECEKTKVIRRLFNKELVDRADALLKETEKIKKESSSLAEELIKFAKGEESND